MSDDCECKSKGLVSMTEVAQIPVSAASARWSLFATWYPDEE